MTCYFDTETGDVYDHTGNKIGNLDNFSESDQPWTGDYPEEVLDVLREAVDENQTTTYNQSLLADMASKNIKRGTPP